MLKKKFILNELITIIILVVTFIAITAAGLNLFLHSRALKQTIESTNNNLRLFEKHFHTTENVFRSNRYARNKH